MISSGAYNYINVLEKTCDASWTRNSLISNNIANVDTPNYKRKDLKFEEYLSSAVTLGSSLDEDIANVDLDTLTGTTLSLLHIRRCRRILTGRSRWSPEH